MMDNRRGWGAKGIAALNEAHGGRAVEESGSFMIEDRGDLEETAKFRFVVCSIADNVGNDLGSEYTSSELG